MKLRVLVILMLCSHGVVAPSVAAESSDSTVVTTRRLSDALLAAGYSWPAVQGHAEWRRHANLQTQESEKQALIQLLREQSRFLPTRENVEAFLVWWQAQSVTGNEWVPETDPNQLLLRPELDPLLAADDTVNIVPLQSSVGIVNGLGVPCSVAFLPRATLRDYLAACQSGQDIASVRLINPSQRPRQVNVASWNADEETVVLPGSWIVLPPSTLTAPDQDAFVSAIAALGPFRSAAAQVPALLELPMRELQPTSSDWGSVGILQMPSARFRSAGNVSATFSLVQPYARYNFMLQPLDWLEAGFRYTDVRNRPFGPASLSGSQTYKDKSIDAKFRLSEETDRFPQLALGLRDIGGTGFFSGEYLVGSKRFDDFDFTLGLGWGNLASRGHFSNPLSLLLSDSFDDREVDFERGAENTDPFKGKTSLFGGVEWHMRSHPIVLKVEYDANSYQREILGQRFDVAFPFNVGATYRLGRNVEAQAALERGNTLSVGITLQGDLSALATEKSADAPSLRVDYARPGTRQGSWADIANTISAQTGAEVLSIRKTADEVNVKMSQPNALYVASRFERAGRVLHATQDDSVQWFNLDIENSGLPVTRVQIDREALSRRATSWQPVDEREPVLSMETPLPPNPSEEVVYQQEPALGGYRLGLDYAQTLGGPDGFVLFQVDAVGTGRYNISKDTWLFGGLRARLFDNYDNFKFDADSGLPRVRTDIRRYLTESPVQMSNLQITHVRDLGDDAFVMFYGGYLERMFAGLGVEWMLRPQGSPVALGIDINRVRQRDFDGGFGLRDYSVTTGHASVYLDTGIQDILAVFKVGRYLAGDIGITGDLSRVFRNGVTMGGYATLTSASSAEFGEGRFSKGLYVSIPFDALFEQSSRNASSLNWTPLTRDGGAILSRTFGLYGMTDLRHPRTLGLRSAEQQ